jgi:hypothetical protein
MNVKLSDLPIENGFYVWRKKDRPLLDYKKQPSYSKLITSNMGYLYGMHNIYISNDRELLSPKGEPAIYACADRIEGEDCRTHLWDGEIYYTIRTINPRLVPKDHWKALYRGFLQLREDLLSESGAK